MERSRLRYLRYLQLWLLVGSSFLCLVAVVNYLVDAYGMFDIPRIQNLNARKPAAGSHVRLAKPYQVTSYQPRAIIGGNSRPEMGLNPAYACWPAEFRPVFNLAMPGASVYMQARMLQHAIFTSESRLVIWGLDFLDFLKRHTGTSGILQWPPKREEFEDSLTVDADGSENHDYGWKKQQDFLRTLFSLDTVKDTLITLSGQANRHSSSIRRDGFNPATDYLEIIEWEGQSVLFEQKNREIYGLFSRPGLKVFQEGSRWSPDFESVRRLLLFARKRRVSVVLFINPYHADYLLTIELAGRWSEFESWKKRIANLANELNVTLWDFSGFNFFSTEQVPSPGDNKSIMKWFWEPAHYKIEYGDLMLSKMLQRQCDEENFTLVGSVLTTGNIDAHITQLRRDMIQYREEQGSAVERLRSIHSDSSQFTSRSNGKH